MNRSLGGARGGATGPPAIFIAGLLWSLGGVFIKSIAAPPAVIACGRSLFAALLFLPFVRRPPAARAWVTVASILTYTGVVGLFVWSTKVTTAANAIILQYTAPVFVFLIEMAALRTRPERRDLLTLAGGMSGILVIYLWSAPGDLFGIGLALLSGVLFAVWMVVTGTARDVDPVSLTFANNLGAFLLLAPAAARSGSLPGGGQLAALAVMGMLQLGLPYLLFTRGVRSVRPHQAALIVLVEPVLNPVWVSLVVAEMPAPATLAGGAIILATLAVRYLVPHRPAAR